MSKDPYPFGHGIPTGGSEGPDRLEKFLRETPVEPAREVFRSELKDRFLLEAVGDLVNGEEPVSEALNNTLNTWQAPAPSAKFRGQMRAQFLTPAKEVLEQAQQSSAEPEQAPDPIQVAKPAPVQRAPKAQTAPKDTTDLPEREIRSAGSSKKGPGKLQSFWAPLAVAAALLLVFLGPKFWGDQAPPSIPSVLAWSLPDSVEDLVWSIDGQRVKPSSSPAEIEQLLNTAKTIAADDGGALRLTYGRLFQIEVAGGSELDLSRFNQTASNTNFRLGMVGDTGGFYFQTGPDFKTNGCELTFRTPEADISVVGTVFAVDRYVSGMGMMEGTCVCCSEGNVRVKATHERNSVTTAGNSCFVSPGDTKLMAGEVVHDHQAPMDRLMGAPLPSHWID